MIIATQQPVVRRYRRRVDVPTVLQARVSAYNAMPGPFEASVDATSAVPAILMWAKAAKDKPDLMPQPASVQRMHMFAASIADELRLTAVQAKGSPASQRNAIRFEFIAR